MLPLLEALDDVLATSINIMQRFETSRMTGQAVLYSKHLSVILMNG